MNDLNILLIYAGTVVSRSDMWLGLWVNMERSCVEALAEVEDEK